MVDGDGLALVPDAYYWVMFDSYWETACYMVDDDGLPYWLELGFDCGGTPNTIGPRILPPVGME